MSYRHPKLGMAIGWKWNHQPGMSTSDGYLAGWPMEPWPTDQDLAQWMAEYEAYLLSNQCKDDELQTFLDSKPGKAVKALALVMIENGACTLAELKTKYRSLP